MSLGLFSSLFSSFSCSVVSAAGLVVTGTAMVMAGSVS